MRRTGALTRRARSLAQAYEVSLSPARLTGAPAHSTAQARGFLSYLNRLTGVAQREEELAALRQESAAMREELDRVAQQLQVRVLSTCRANICRHCQCPPPRLPCAPGAVVLTPPACFRLSPGGGDTRQERAGARAAAAAAGRRSGCWP